MWTFDLGLPCSRYLSWVAMGLYWYVGRAPETCSAVQARADLLVLCKHALILEAVVDAGRPGSGRGRWQGRSCQQRRLRSFQTVKKAN